MKDNNIYKIKTPYSDEEYTVRIFALSYLMPQRLAVHLFDIDSCEPFLDATVNIPDEPISGDDCAFIDTNNYPWIGKFLQSNNIAKPTGYIGMSGYCTYPEYRFDLSKLTREDGTNGSM